jgi:hypothetical protein
VKLNRYLLAMLAGAAIVLPVSAQAAAPVRDQSGVAGAEQERLAQDGKASTQLCRPGSPDLAPPTTQYFENNQLFGPTALPLAEPVGPLLTDYSRFGALNSTDFLTQYGNTARDAYVFPPASGFVIGYEGKPIRFAQDLKPGTRLDRFGHPGGGFLAPLGTPFAQRGLPSMALNTPAPSPIETLVPLANYHIYCVVKPFTVDTGPITPWFAQPSLGTQYKLESKYLPEAGALLSVTWLLQHGYLVEERPFSPGTEPCPAPATPAPATPAPATPATPAVTAC